MGTDYLWNFQTDCTIRGKPDEPVAVETELGWALLMESFYVDDFVSGAGPLRKFKFCMGKPPRECQKEGSS